MNEVSREVAADPEAVYRVLADGWTYGAWVVGNSRVRHVDPDWPAPGSRIHHSVGVWPVRLDDVTEVCAAEPGRLLELRARLWHFGVAIVRITLRPLGRGVTRVAMAEEFTRGPVSVLPSLVQDFALWPRNAESLRRLGDLAVGRARYRSDQK